MRSTWRIVPGDALERLRELPDSSVHCCITSPPYFGLRDYGVDGQIGLEATPDEYVDKLVAVFREVRRVLRDDGTLWLNIGDSYAGSWGAQGRREAPATISRNQIANHPKKASRTGVIRQDGVKPKDLYGIPWMLAFALRADGWYLRSDIIWCLSGDARVYARTQKGDMPMAVKDLVRLDPATVKLWNGEKWTQALGWGPSPEPRDGALEVVLRSGERIGCTPGHEWPTQRGNVRADELVPGDVIATTRLPEPDVPARPAHIDLDVAWMLGLYLAEGSPDGARRLQFAGHANQTDARVMRLRRIADVFGGSVRSHSRGDSASVIVDCPPLAAVVAQYVHGATAKTKGLRPRCWHHEDRWLRALLDGYLAGAGHFDEKNGRWRLGFTRNDRLAADLRTLAARLGCTLTLHQAHGEGFGKRWPIYRGELRFERREHHNAKDRAEVVEVRRSRARQFWDIAVKDEPHLFALASGVLTHNCKPNPMPESVRDRPTRAHEYLFLLAKSPRYYYDANAIKEPDNGQASGNGFVRDHRLSYRNATGQGRGRTEQWTPGGGRNKRSVWTVVSQPFRGAHFATFPPKLVEPCVLAGCPKGGVVLDPFAGAATTGVVALRHDRSFVGIELNPEYVELARARLIDDAPLLNFLSEESAA